MCRLGLLVPVSLLAVVSACTRDNPAFDDCETECIGESLGSGDGDGDSGDGDTGDGDGEAGDGDGDTGDGDTGDGDGDTGDGDTGDGDGDTGDGDGDGDEPAIPMCPDSAWVSVPLLKDTFLDGTYDGLAGCTVDWNFQLDTPMNSADNGECSGLDFGGSLGHWACVNGMCNSVWLGKFALADLKDLQILEAGLAFASKYRNAEANVAHVFELDVTNVNFGECVEWHAGDGMGDPPTPCATTFIHSAFPNLWGSPVIAGLDPSAAIGTANIPMSADAFVEYQFEVPLDHNLVQSWISGQNTHEGVVLTTGAWLPTEFYLFAQGSGKDPVLRARVCTP